MDVTFRPIRRPFFLVLLLVALLMTACSGALGGGNWPGISADADTLYLAYGTELVALEPGNSTPIWRFPAPSATALLLAAPGLDDNSVYIGNYGESQGLLSPGVQASVYVIDKDGSGEVSSRVTYENVAQDRIVASPQVADGKIFVGTSDNQLVALDASSNTILWGDRSDEDRFGHSVWGQPAFADGIVVATSMDTTVRAFDADSGDQIWMQTLGGAVAAAPLIDGDTVFVSGFDSQLHAFDLQSGDEQWVVSAEDWIWNAPVLLDGTLFFGDIKGNVYAVDSVSGDIEWSTQVDGSIETSLLAANGAVLVPVIVGVSTGDQTGTLVSLSTQDGSINWQQDLAQPTFSAPVMIGSEVALVLTTLNNNGSGEPTVQLYNVETGVRGWTWTPSDAE